MNTCPRCNKLISVPLQQHIAISHNVALDVDDCGTVTSDNWNQLLKKRTKLPPPRLTWRMKILRESVGTCNVWGLMRMRLWHYKTKTRDELETPHSTFADRMEESRQMVDGIDFPCIIRPSFTMGSSNERFAVNPAKSLPRKSRCIIFLR